MIAFLLFMILLALVWPSAVRFILTAIGLLFILAILVAATGG
jgi:hypothetical protein